MTVNESSLLERAAPGILFAQELPPRAIYSIKQHGVEVAGSEKTAYRRIKPLIQLGLANYNRGQFEIKKEVVAQPLNVIKKLLPSLLALKQARRFGRSYNNADINFVDNHRPESAFVTLDFKAWALTRFQYPNDLYVYVNDIESGISFLKKNEFSEGSRGHIVLLPKLSSFENEIEQVYLDCIANGGRSILDAIALQLVYPDQITVRGRFPVETVKKVQEDMPYEKLKEIASSNT
ncbi:MAG: conserved hypothetical protein [Marine Group I thaumarchaeote]|nr:MAG: conserved hypothetical protein [Marine Group I thaumarchaeote]